MMSQADDEPIAQNFTVKRIESLPAYTISAPLYTV
jgi:hypothetical protein